MTLLAARSLVVLSVFLLGCSQQPPDTRAADEAAIRAAEAAWSKVAGAKQLDATVSYYSADASVLAPNAPIATTAEAIRATWAQMFALPGFAIQWQPTRVELARSGDLAFAQGTYEMTMTGPQGSPVTDRGKYVDVWKKQADGAWKVVADIFNSDMPLPAPPSSK